jgi:hypothetical protein
MNVARCSELYVYHFHLYLDNSFDRTHLNRLIRDISPYLLLYGIRIELYNKCQKSSTGSKLNSVLNYQSETYKDMNEESIAYPPWIYKADILPFKRIPYLTIWNFLYGGRNYNNLSNRSNHETIYRWPWF